MKINVKSKGTQPTCQMPFVLSCEHWLISAYLTKNDQRKHLNKSYRP